MGPNRRAFVQGGLAAAALPYLPLPTGAQDIQASADELWYTKPAGRWLEALPVGNGRLGGMIYGGIEKERIALSESTAWSGQPSTDEVNPEALPHLQQIRDLFFAGEYSEAQALCRKSLPAHWKNFGTNLPLPELLIVSSGIGEATEYRRSLNLDEAIGRVAFRSKGVDFTREFFATHADGILVFHFAADTPGHLNLRCEFGEGVFPCTVTTRGTDTLLLNARCLESKHSDGQSGVALRVQARALQEGGTIVAEDHALTIKAANTVTILVAIATSFRDADPNATCEARVRRAAGRGYAALRQAHLADYRPLYRRMSLTLGASSAEARQQPTDVRRKALENGADDPELIALFFQYGRYLTIAGSRADSPLPLALQGIWNDGLASSMGWTDDFHLDINTQQNYWPTEVTNLSECQTPLFGLIDILRAAGRSTAQQMYGAPGWMVHTVTNPWGFTAPGSPGWGLFVTAGIWTSLQLWDHYRFTGDVTFLRARAYPALRELAEFYLHYMVAEPKHGWLVTGPSDSPENWYVAPNGDHLAESMGCTIDRVMVYALYSICIEAGTTLKTDRAFCARLQAARAKLPPFQIGKHGQLQEWLEDYEDAEPNHRHTSHLTALYPEHQISPRGTPELARAAEVTLERRIHALHWEQSEWGRANLAVYYARLLKGDEAYRSLLGLVGKATYDNLLTYSSAGVAGADSNIFAIDGNTAGTAGIAEMLLQSQAGEIELLPALPTAWPAGTVRGLCARGGYVVDIRWAGSKLVSATVYSRYGGAVPVRYGEQVKTFPMRAGESRVIRQASFDVAAV